MWLFWPCEVPKYNEHLEQPKSCKKVKGGSTDTRRFSSSDLEPPLLPLPPLKAPLLALLLLPRLSSLALRSIDWISSMEH